MIIAFVTLLWFIIGVILVRESIKEFDIDGLAPLLLITPLIIAGVPLILVFIIVVVIFEFISNFRLIRYERRVSEKRNNSDN